MMSAAACVALPVWPAGQPGSLVCVCLAPDLACLAACLLCCAAHAVTVLSILLCGWGRATWWLCFCCFVCACCRGVVRCGVVLSGRLPACPPVCLPACSCSCCLALLFCLPALPLHRTAALLCRPCACLTIVPPSFPLPSSLFLPPVNPVPCLPDNLPPPSAAVKLCCISIVCRLVHNIAWRTCVCVCLLSVTVRRHSPLGVWSGWLSPKPISSGFG